MRAPRARGSATSNAAADLGSEGHRATQRRQVLRALRQAGRHGRTRGELERATGLDGDCVRPRVWELRKAKQVRQTPRVRLTRKGREAFVLVLTQRGRRACGSQS